MGGVISIVLNSCNFREKAVFDDVMDGIKSTTDKVIDDENGKVDAQGNLVNKPKVDLLKKNSNKKNLAIF